MTKLKSIHIGTILFIDENGKQIDINNIVEQQFDLYDVRIITNKGNFELKVFHTVGNYSICLIKNND